MMDWAGTTLTVAVFAPLLAAPLAFVLGHRALPWLALLTASLVLFSLLAALMPPGGGSLLIALGGWQAPLGILWRHDGASAATLLVSAAVAAAILVYASAYPALSRWQGRALGFWPVFLLLWGGLNALFLAADLFNLYVTLELVSLAAVALVVLEGSASSLTAGMRYLLIALVGSLCYLLGVAQLYGQYGLLAMEQLGAVLESNTPSRLAMALISAGLCAKAAIFPLHVWLPAAHGQAPAPASAALSALVVMAPMYILYRLHGELFPPLHTPGLLQGLGILGAAAIVWGSLQALVQTRLKLLIAYSTVAQLGYFMLYFPLLHHPGAWAGGFYLMLSHALAKAAMFLGAGTILHALGHDRIHELRGVASRMPMTVLAFGVAGMTLLGLPPSGGFIGKWLLLQAAIEGGQWRWVVVLLLGGLLTAGYLFRLLRHVFNSGPDPRRAPVAKRLELTALLLAAASLLVGLAAKQPTLMLLGTAPTGVAP
ncbi:complex I subunit 5 family protein [Alkalilimnicola sp. S0819]|uniref:complex I subunit 5 family protein n=1 Tax=Alkalilimnicola sp. S0819 TaxID=2613922 RepID=UPI00126226F4|nr:proton-conducting transporter membrane subunit [Alkalilimnicola sp. S0819]KAB7627477.1 oxidoreductase [Alkalilimnicola sp. S0819]MPQ15629.1 oxidoreductase [Alkalilimnicola sp. S0819]